MSRRIRRKLGMIATRVGDLMRREVPYDTGNMMENVTVRRNSADEWAIIIPADKVPYTVYTVEPWKDRPGHNPNQYWINDVAKTAAQLIASMVGGTVVEAPDLPPGEKNENSGKPKKNRDKIRHREAYKAFIQKRKEQNKIAKAERKRRTKIRKIRRKIWSVSKNLRRIFKNL